MLKQLGVWGSVLLLAGSSFAQETKESPAAETPAVVEKASEVASSNLVIKPYGYFKLDVALDDSTTNNVDYPWWVNAGDQNNAKGTVHAKQTRLGLWFAGPDVGQAQWKGQFEFDLTNPGSETKYFVGIRHAYGQLDWKHFSLLAGHTWDVIGPLNPNTVNYIVGWNVGNMGFRRPQVRVTARKPLGDWNLQTALAITRNVGEDFSALGASDDGGEEAAIPQIQGRMGLHGKLAGRNAQIGISGHFSKEDYGAAIGKHNSYSFNGDLMIPFTDWLMLQGEIFKGRNLDAHFGGIGQGVDTGLNVGIRSFGGWANLQFLSPCGHLEGNLGFGLDNPKDGDLSAGKRSKNLMTFANIQYILSEAFRVAFEYSYWKTHYAAGTSSDNNRYQLAFIYNLPKS